MAASTAVTLEDTPGRAGTSDRTAQVAALTGLRGFAALMVVVVHVSGLTQYAWLGIPSYGPVSLFVLSGYLLYRPWAKWGMQIGERPSVKVFARRRVARIFPAYLLVLVVVAVVYPPSRPADIEGWFHAVTITWIYQSNQLASALAQTWSLATELSWYVALPVMAGITTAVARKRSPRTGFWISAAMISLSLPITVAWRWWVAVQDLDNNVPYLLWLPGFLACFAGGALVAHFAEGYRAGLLPLRRLRSLATDPWALPVFALAVALIGTSSLGGPPGFPETSLQEEVRLGCAAVVAVTLLAVVVLGGPDSPVSRLLGTKGFVAIGRWSYGIFLWHFPLIVILQDDITYPDGPAGLAFRLVWILGLSILLGAATYAWVEQPAIRWSQRLPAADPPVDVRAVSTVASAEPDQRNVRDQRAQGAQRLPAGTEPETPSSTTSAQPTAPNPTQPRRLPPAE